MGYFGKLRQPLIYIPSLCIFVIVFFSFFCRNLDIFSPMFDPRYLEFEITESTIMKNPEMAITLLQNLISLGIQISVDDFGTGYSSLSYLRRLPLTTLKIDRSFIRELPVNKDDISIVKAITVLAHSLRLKVVAEGVETQEQHDFLKEIGCDGMQGFFWNKPLPSNDITTILTREKT